MKHLVHILHHSKCRNQDMEELTETENVKVKKKVCPVLPFWRIFSRSGLYDCLYDMMIPLSSLLFSVEYKVMDGMLFPTVTRLRINSCFTLVEKGRMKGKRVREKRTGNGLFSWHKVNY